MEERPPNSNHGFVPNAPTALGLQKEMLFEFAFSGCPIQMLLSFALCL